MAWLYQLGLFQKAITDIENKQKLIYSLIQNCVFIKELLFNINKFKINYSTFLKIKCPLTLKNKNIKNLDEFNNYFTKQK